VGVVEPAWLTAASDTHMCSTNYSFARDEEGERGGARGLRLVGIEAVGSDGNSQDVEEEEEGKYQSTAKSAAQLEPRYLCGHLTWFSLASALVPTRRATEERSSLETV